jgi:hypothetical protein
MEFGIFSNGERTNQLAADTYYEDVYEIVTADKLGLKEAWVSEHVPRGDGSSRPDTVPVADLLICKSGALTKRSGRRRDVDARHRRRQQHRGASGADERSYRADPQVLDGTRAIRLEWRLLHGQGHQYPAQAVPEAVAVDRCGQQQR